MGKNQSGTCQKVAPWWLKPGDADHFLLFSDSRESGAGGGSGGSGGCGGALCGVMRIGLVAKGLLIKGDMDLELVLMCREKPTKTLLYTVSANLPLQIQVTSRYQSGNAARNILTRTLKH